MSYSFKGILYARVITDVFLYNLLLRASISLRKRPHDRVHLFSFTLELVSDGPVTAQLPIALYIAVVLSELVVTL